MGEGEEGGGQGRSGQAAGGVDMQARHVDARTTQMCPPPALARTCATLMSRFSRFSWLPPSQYCSELTKLRASLALSLGRNLRILGRVRTSFRRLSSKLSLF